MYKPFSYNEAGSFLNHALELPVSTCRGHTMSRGPAVGQMASSVVAPGIIQALVERLQECNAAGFDTDGIPEGLADSLVNAIQIANDEGSREENDEEDKHNEVKNGETNHPSLAKLRLLERVDRGTNLATVIVGISKQQITETWVRRRTLVEARKG